MATTRSALTDADIRCLVKGASPDERAAAARKLCRSIDTAPLSDADRELAGEILRVMAADAAERVRQAISETLKASPLVPHDVALALAKDVESVCLPMLSFSPAFSDADLTEIVRLGGPVRQVAIARRPELSPTVTASFAEHGCERAVTVACANPGARFDAPDMARIIDRFETSERVLAAIAYRSVLPLAVSEKLISLVGDQVRAHLVAHHGVDPRAAEAFATGATDQATVDLIDQASRADDVRGFVADLAARNRLSATFLLRALAHGQMAVFEWGVAELSGVPHHRTWLMIHDSGPLGLKAIYERAGLPARMFPTFRTAVDTFHDLSLDGGARDRERFQARMLERVLTHPEANVREDADYLLSRLSVAGTAH
jgi:uncharacterized protein (DUF2336 family)